MFSKLFGSKTKIQRPAQIPAETDYSFGDPTAARAAGLLKGSDYPALADLYETASSDEKSFILNRCCLSADFTAPYGAPWRRG